MTRTLEEVRQEIEQVKATILDKERNISELNQSLSQVAARNGALNVQIQNATDKVCEAMREFARMTEENQREKLARIPEMADRVTAVSTCEQQVWARLKALDALPPHEAKRKFTEEVTQSRENKLLTGVLVAAAQIACVVLFVVM